MGGGIPLAEDGEIYAGIGGTAEEDVTIVEAALR
jgi:hypothetical protein